MIGHERPAPIKSKFLTPGTCVLIAIALAGVGGYLFRLFAGIGAATNLSDQYPWGIWIAIDVATGVALAAGGFTTAALADIFHKEKYHVIVRPALLTALLGYTFVVIGLLADLGRYYNVWHPILPSMWQGNSVLFEVGLCVMVYLTVLYIEFLPIIVEKFKGRVNLPRPLAFMNHLIESFFEIAQRSLSRVISVFIIAGVVLSCLHQSSLGTLMVIAPSKMHPLWYTQMSPLLFLLSAIAVGFPMVVFESILASRSFKLKPEMSVLSSIARYTPILLAVYLAVKIGDLTLRESWGYVTELSSYSIMWLIEIGVGVVLPMILLLQAKVRRNAGALFASVTMVIFGVALNRINVFLIAYRPPYVDTPYFPSLVELMVTAGLISTLVLVYRAVVMYLPIITVPDSHVAPPSPPMSRREVAGGEQVS